MGLALCGANLQHHEINALLKYIESRLVVSEFCVVFENELERVWPSKGKGKATRASAVQAFAKANKLSVVIHDPGWGVTFKKLGEPPFWRYQPKERRSL